MDPGNFNQEILYRTSFYANGCGTRTLTSEEIGVSFGLPTWLQGNKLEHRHLPVVPMTDILPSTPIAKVKGDIVLAAAETTPDNLHQGSGGVPPALFISGSPLATDKKKQFLPPTKDDGRNVRRRKTAIVLDSDYHSTTNRNIFLSLESLLAFIGKHFSCKRCHKSMQGAGSGEATLQLEVFGIGYGINFNCECGVSNSLHPSIAPDAKETLKTLEDSKPYGTRVNSGDFEINHHLQLGLYLCAGGDRMVTI
jgi:hypothetical protein